MLSGENCTRSLPTTEIPVPDQLTLRRIAWRCTDLTTGSVWFLQYNPGPGEKFTVEAVYILEAV